MTPKSVSGTSLILALGAVLTWPVWGWAEITTTCTKKHEKDYTHTIIVTQGTHDLYLACGGRICATGATQDEATATMACYRRMREAMKAVNPYIVDIYKPFRLDHTKPDETLKDNQHAITQWNAVMKDCVDGSK